MLPGLDSTFVRHSGHTLGLVFVMFLNRPDSAIGHSNSCIARDGRQTALANNSKFLRV